MRYEEFEWHILRMVYEQGLDRIQPSYVAYAMGIPHETASEYLERAAQAGVLELDVTEDGSIEYFIPGADPNASMPDPIWKKKKRAAERRAEGGSDEQANGDRARSDRARSSEAPARGGPAGGSHDVDRSEREAESGLAVQGPSGRSAPNAAAEQSPPQDKGADGTIDRADSQVPAPVHTENSLPAPVQHNIQNRTSSTDGTLDASLGGRRTVVDRDVSVHSSNQPEVVTALENSDRDLPIHIESTEETFSDPSQTIFMRQLRVEGVESEGALREHVHRLFDSLGYQMVESDGDRLRFERGSVTFILALVPLFVLVLPLFVYLFLYCMGRSTIHQEPLELDVHLRESSDGEHAYDIDLTFIGLHGVVLGAADQRVLNKEVDTLRDELHWALTSG